jgi:hypothetical protein
VVVKADQGVRDPAVQRRVTDLLGHAAALPHVQAVRSPYSDAGRAQIAPDGTVAFATPQLEHRDLHHHHHKEATAMPTDSFSPFSRRRAGGRRSSRGGSA